MRHEIVGGTLLCVHGPAPASEADWNAYVETSKGQDYGGVLVVTDPGYPGPTSAQRKQVAKVMNQREKRARIAVVTPSALHRGIVTVEGWLQRGNLLAFHPARLREAMEYAGVPEPARAEVLGRVHALARSLDCMLAGSAQLA